MSDSRERPPVFSQEEDDVPARGILLVILAVLAFGTVGVLWVQRIEPARHSAFIEPSGTAGQMPIRLTAIAPDTLRVRAPERPEQSSYGWIDRERGLVHIPIEQAMDIVAERGR